ncbi:hypothetical protein [Burkholderia cepacia]|uniref:hypothetical protein n=1 Tax=Burkholderia cepacia TaxID=292 RepID=UPI00158CE619|nr:hypothetical protein [Burkholderia cepacia]
MDKNSGRSVKYIKIDIGLLVLILIIVGVLWFFVYSKIAHVDETLTRLATPGYTTLFQSNVKACDDDGKCLENVLLVRRGIDNQASEKFKDAVTKAGLKEGGTVCFDSPGGDMEQGAAIGEYIVRNKLNTCLAAHYSWKDNNSTEYDATPVCESACTYAFLGGVKRTLLGFAFIGIHDVSGDNREPPTAGQVDHVRNRIESLIKTYRNILPQKSQGASIDGAMDLFDVASRTPASSIRLLSPRAAKCGFGFFTDTYPPIDCQLYSRNMD